MQKFMVRDFNGLHLLEIISNAERLTMSKAYRATIYLKYHRAFSAQYRASFNIN